MIERVTKIVSEYTKIPIDQLQSETQIGRSVINNSIILHRMYAAIAKVGIEITGYQEIKTFGQLINKMTQMDGSENIVMYNPKAVSTESHEIGIDIEEISKMPKVTDFREAAFYTMNFTPEEIAYCVLQPDQYASFTGLFAAKEAIIKADNGYKKITFDKIFIDHLPGGRPVFDGFNISISHTENVSIAVAIKNNEFNKTDPSNQNDTYVRGSNRSSILISIIAIIIAIIAICIVLFK